MAENIKCPVCGKTGIPDFLNNDVKCPCCGSDLSIYRVIENIPEEGAKFNIWKPISVAALIAATGLVVLLLRQPPAESPAPNDEIALLEDSIKILNSQLVKVKATIENSNFAYKYRVLKGDSYWSISRKFYGTGTRADEIAKLNNRTIETPLNIGDSLKIE